MSSTTPTGPPPVPPSKPILSTPGSYMSTFQAGHATIHSINKTQEKPAIAARPVMPPTVPKYNTPTPFGSKIERNNEREKVWKNKVDKIWCWCRMKTEPVAVPRYKNLLETTLYTHCWSFDVTRRPKQHIQLPKLSKCWFPWPSR